MSLPQEVVLYHPSIPTEQGWRRLVQLLETGQVKRVVTTAHHLRHTITPELERKDFHEVAEFGFEGQPALGRLRRRDGGALLTTTYTATGDGWEPVVEADGRTLAVSRAVGEGRLIVLLFDPRARTEAALEIYRDLLAEAGVMPHWRSADGSAARIYRDGELFLVGVQTRGNRAWWDAGGRGPDTPLVERRMPYHMPGERAEVRARLPGEAEAYDWVSLPSGARGRVEVEEGFVSLRVEDVGHELFFLAAAGTQGERLEELAKRREAFYDALTFGGRFPHGPQPE
jgi:hypothetical protein